MEPRLLLGLVGAGIRKSLAPFLQEEEGRQHGLRIHYQLIDLEGREDDAMLLPGLLRAARVMGFAGLNITHPCKQAVVPFLDAVAEEARAIGAVNTIIRDGDRLLGHNSDGAGWSWGFRRRLPGADLSSVVVIGAGGAGAACADAVLRLGASQVRVHDRDAVRSAALVARLNEHLEGKRAGVVDDLQAALAEASGLIHATPTGMARYPGLPFPERWLRPALWVSEVVYVPLETPLLAAARRAGCRTMDGGHMNVGQAAMGFRLFTGLEADAERMDVHFRRLLDGPTR